MNIAFSSLILLAFLLPGLIFSVAFISSDHKPITYVPLTHKTILSIFATFVLQALWLELVSFFGYTINVHSLLILSSGMANNEYAHQLNNISAKNLSEFFVYFFTLYVFAFFSAKGIRWLIKITRLDSNFKFLRLENKWHYLFGGHDWEEGDPEGVVVAVTMELASKGYLYLGILNSFELNSEGNLDYLILSSAARRDIDKDKLSQSNEAKDRFYSIDSDSIVLKYEHIKTLNVQYVKIKEDF